MISACFFLFYFEQVEFEQGFENILRFNHFHAQRSGVDAGFISVDRARTAL